MDVQEVIDSTKMALMINEPFYGIILSKLKLEIIDKPIPLVAAVNYTTLTLNVSSTNPVNILSMPVDTRITLLKHELQHVIFGHLDHSKDLDGYIVNIAQDAVIHRTLLKERSTCLDYFPKGIVKPIKDSQGTFNGFQFGSGAEKLEYIIPNFDKLDWYSIYLAIETENKKRKGSVSYDYVDVKPDTDSEKDKEEFEEILLQAAEMNWGDLPNEIQEKVNKLRNPKIAWNSYLYNAIRTEITRTDYSWKSDSRFSHITIMTPQLKTESVRDVYVVLDTSGSMSLKDISDGISEFKSLRETISFRLHFVQCDASVQDVQTYEEYEEPEWEQLKVKGRGGTSFCPVFKLVESKEAEFDKPALLIYYTDGFGSFGKGNYDYPIIWVTKTKNTKIFPFGQVIVID